MTTNYKCRAGFTLIEILIVVAIIVILFAFLVPSVISVMRKFNEDAARIQIQRLETHLEEYVLKEREYPTNEQGLYALVYIPDNVGGFQQPGGMMGTTNMMGMGQNQEFGGMAGGSGGLGLTNSPMTPQDMTGTGGGFDPTFGQQMTNPISGQMSTDGTMMTGSAWNQPVHNPQLYMLKRPRSSPYAKDEKQLIDPWKLLYRYDNSRDQYDLNPYTGEKKPAIWSAGPDNTDFTDDDIRNWVPAEANQKRQERMQQLQMQQQQMGGMMDGGMMGGSGVVGPNSMNNQMGTGMPQMPGGTGMPQMPGGTGMPQMPGM